MFVVERITGTTAANVRLRICGSCNVYLKCNKPITALRDGFFCFYILEYGLSIELRSIVMANAFV